jgi:hypothetical protein
MTTNSIRTGSCTICGEPRDWELEGHQQAVCHACAHTPLDLRKLDYADRAWAMYREGVIDIRTLAERVPQPGPCPPRCTMTKCILPEGHEGACARAHYAGCSLDKDHLGPCFLPGLGEPIPSAGLRGYMEFVAACAPSDPNVEQLRAALNTRTRQRDNAEARVEKAEAIIKELRAASQPDPIRAIVNEAARSGGITRIFGDCTRGMSASPDWCATHERSLWNCVEVLRTERDALRDPSSNTAAAIELRALWRATSLPVHAYATAFRILKDANAHDESFELLRMLNDFRAVDSWHKTPASNPTREEAIDALRSIRSIIGDPEADTFAAGCLRAVHAVVSRILDKMVPRG